MQFFRLFCNSGILIKKSGKVLKFLWSIEIGFLWQSSSGQLGGGPRVVVSTAAFHARDRGLVLGLGGFIETKNVSSPYTCESQYCGEPP